LTRCDCWFGTNSAIWTRRRDSSWDLPRGSRTGAACRASDRSHVVDARRPPSSHTRPRSVCTRGVRDRTRQGCDSYAGAALRSEGDSRGVSPFPAVSTMSLPGSQNCRRPAAGHVRQSGLDRPRPRLAAARAPAALEWRGTPMIESYLLYEEVGDRASSTRGLDHATHRRPVAAPRVVGDAPRTSVAAGRAER
jgi:hypothetical protein